MSENRAEKAGFAKEAQNKINSKYDPALAEELLVWIGEITGEQFESTSGEQDNFYQILKDGTVLCKLINAFEPDNAIPEKKIKKSKFPFQCMENIQLFTEQATKLGVAKHETFQSVDLFEKQNLYSVLICLSSLARKAHKFGLKGVESLGREAEKNVREFTKEQLAESNKIISLQYGSNKGATQAGINFGNTRHM
ncbi:hypothetical protein L1887_63339 [Cichorium endivia]|nr:hypothetical protein L1887_63339 [Cichorium endivia]